MTFRKMTINESQDEIIEEFELFDDWADKYEYIIDLGKKLKGLPEEQKTEDNIIKGCQSRVWLNAHKGNYCERIGQYAYQSFIWTYTTGNCQS
jgi:sulfur transfer protein SufE